MARKASSKPSDSSATVVASFGIRHSGFVISSVRVQHFNHHLAPQGMAGFVLANGSMSSNQSGEGDIRRALIEADLVDCMVALDPFQSFMRLSAIPSLN